MTKGINWATHLKIWDASWWEGGSRAEVDVEMKDPQNALLEMMQTLGDILCGWRLTG